MDAIWGACEGYTGVRGFPSFITAHAHEPGAYYIAFRDETVASITSAIAARRRRHALQDAAGPSLTRASRRRCRDRLVVRSIVSERGYPRGPCRARISSAQSRRTDSATSITARRRITSEPRSLSRVPPAQLDHQKPHAATDVSLQQRSPRPVRPFAPLAPGDEIPAEWTAIAPAFREDAVAQNQLTLVTVIDPASVGRVRAVLAAIDSYARRLAPPGSFIGISTIHFVRWLLIDRGRRLLFISDYDGIWESYIDEFAEMILSGLDAIWETSFGMPPDGARDLPAFKRFLRSHQVPSDIFFAAYPDDDRAECRGGPRQVTEEFIDCAADRRSPRRHSRHHHERLRTSAAGGLSVRHDDASPMALAGGSHAYLRSITYLDDAGRDAIRRAPNRSRPSMSASRRQGLRATGLPARCCAPSRPSFRTASPHPSGRAFSATQTQCAGGWEVGGPRTDPVHAVLLLFAANEPTLDELCRAQRAPSSNPPTVSMKCQASMQRGYRPETASEPFGFHDGIAQPSIAGLDGRGVPTGEFILGYENHYGLIPPTPVVPRALDPGGTLPRLSNPHHAATELGDLGRTAPTSYIESSSRTSPDSGSSWRERPRARGSTMRRASSGLPPSASDAGRRAHRWRWRHDAMTRARRNETISSTPMIVTDWDARSAPISVGPTRVTCSSRIRPRNREHD